MLLGFLKYTGNIPAHILKMDWTPGMQVSLGQIYKIFGSRCLSTDKLDNTFINWFIDKFSSTLEQNFELSVEEDLQGQDEELLEEISSEGEKKVMVESSSITTSSSVEAAKEKLRRMRHSELIGSVDTESEDDMLKTNLTMRETIKMQPKPGTAIMTGDDLAESRKMVVTSKVGNRYMLDSEGRPVIAKVTTKEEAARENSGMSELSRNSQILAPEFRNSDGTTSKVMIGENTTKPKKEVKEDTRKVNKNFKAYPMAATRREVTPEDIAQNKDESEAVLLINQCKDVTVLKVARVYARDTGKQRLVELIDRRINRLPRI